jgi:hypothetical protein
MKKTLLIISILVLVVLLFSVPRNKVIVEIGTGTWCTYCPGAAMGADDLVDNGHSVAIVENHNGDTYANTYSNARNTYYGITGYPTANFDGTNPSVGGSHTASMYSNYLPKVNTRMAVASHFTISSVGQLVGSTYNVTATLDKTEADTNTNLRLHCVVTESHIQQAWQGQTHLNFVTRLMTPDQNGTTINFGTDTQVVVPLTFNMNPAWVVNNCEVVIFLQNNTTKEILQGVKYTFPELFGAYPASATSLNFPDTYLSNMATIPLTINNYWNMTINGTIESDNLAFVACPLDRVNFTIQPYQSKVFNVVFTPTVTGTVNGNINIVSNLPEHNSIVIPVTGYGFFNAAPTAANVSISGVPVVSMMQTASYTFVDSDNDTEGTSTYQWYRVTPNVPVPTPIDGATGMTYRLQQADIGSSVAFMVTPSDEHSMPGASVLSEPTPLVETYPAPQNLTYQIIDEHDVTLTWEAPIHFNRDFVGYRIYRNGLNIFSTNNPNILTFTDTWLADGDYEYWATTIFNNPITQSLPSNVVNVHIGPVSADNQVINAVETMQIYPNPFKTSSTVYLTGKANAHVSVDVFNVKGQMVKKLNGVSDSNGNTALSLNSANDLNPGIYFVTVKASGKSITSKVLVLK